MAKSSPAFQFYPGDFIAGTLHLDAEAIGCYLLLLCQQWSQGKLPSNISELSLICRMTETKFAPIWRRIEDKFVASPGGGLVNVRLKTIRDKQLDVSQKRAESGHLGGEANASRLLKQKQSKGSMKNEDRSMKNNKKKNDIETPFENFYRHYPRKAARAAAAKAYAKAVERLKEREPDPVAFLWGRVIEFAQSDVAKGDFCPYPSTWLNGERYDDDPATWARGSPKNGDPRGNLALRDKLLAEFDDEQN